jgi:hypothetical protein
VRIVDEQGACFAAVAAIHSAQRRHHAEYAVG